jgi:GAF domain-containing protein
MESTIIPHPTLPKKERYQQLCVALEGLLSGESDFTANSANMAALIFQSFEFHWVGFYWVKGQELVLGAFQGPVACTRIKLGKGVCGKAWETEQSILVPNVNEFPGHIACSPISQSELVIPIVVDKEIIGVLDIDSAYLNDFDEEDQIGMASLIQIFEKTLS